MDFHLDTTFTGFVVDAVREPLVRLAVKPFVAVTTPVPLVDTFQITDDQRSHIVIGAPLHDVLAETVQEVSGAPR